MTDKKTTEKDALSRAEELFNTPMQDVPKLAAEYMRAMCRLYCACGEVMLTAFAHYAQFEEGLSCSDILYKPSKKDQELFERVKKAVCSADS